MVEIQNLVKRFGSKYAVDDISFTIKAGETVSISGGSDWHMVVVSELPIDPTLHQMSNFVFADHQLAVLEPTAGTVETVDNGTYPISDRDKGASAAVYLKNLPYYLLNKSLIKVKLTDDVQATVTKAGKVFLIASTSEKRKAHYEAEGYTLVEDLKEKYAQCIGIVIFNDYYFFVLYTC